MNITHLKLNEGKAAIVFLFVTVLCHLQFAHIDEIPHLDEVPVDNHLDPFVVCGAWEGSRGVMQLPLPRDGVLARRF